MSVAAIVLAAGRGTRFGATPKLLAELDGKPLVRFAAEAALAAGCGPVLVVTGHRETEIMAALAGLPLTFVRNPDHADGLSTSLRAGFAALPEDIEAAAILLGDMPRVTGDLIQALIGAWRQADRPDAVVPTFGGRRGNPAILSASLAPEIARLRGDAGAGQLLRGRPGTVDMPVETDAVTLDIDTPEALRAVRTPPGRTIAAGEPTG